MQAHWDATATADLVDKLARDVAAAVPDGATPVVVGLRTRGDVLAGRLAEKLNARRGALDITLYRDDLSELGPQPVVRGTDLGFGIDGAHVVLVDDVLHTGRSVRAALDQLADFGRPAAVRLAVLVDRRGGRELPIQADVAALTLDAVARGDRVYVHLLEQDGRDEIVVKAGAR